MDIPPLIAPLPKPVKPSKPSRSLKRAALTGTGLTEQDLERFRSVQRLAYDCLQEVAAGLKAGVTEKEAAAEIRAWLLSRGVTEWFHTPYAWFGERSAFRGVRRPWEFFPTNKKLEEGMPFILDVGPVVDGYVADIGYSACLGRNPTFERMRADLPAYRDLILEAVRARKPFREIYEAVDALIVRHGYVNCHQRYPGRVLGHRVERLTSKPSRFVLAGFGLQSLRAIGRDYLAERKEHRSPLWADGKASDHAPTPGIWAVEPHVGFGEVGVKFEELLVVTQDDAFWLDDDLPHVRQGKLAATPKSTAKVSPKVARDFEDKLVLITGGASGIGRATALAFAEQGAKLLIADIDSKGAARTAELAQFLGAEAHWFPVDVSSAKAMEKFAQNVAATHGVPDILVNNAGVGVAGPFLDTTVAEWERTLGVNLWGVIHGARLFGKLMAERKRGGHIVNVASAAAFLPNRTLPAYSTTKAAVLMLSECLRAELGDAGIGVTAICPGMIDTPIVGSAHLTDPALEKNRSTVQRIYRRRNFPPQGVAKQILAAVRSNPAVVMVTLEAKVGRALSRYAPASLRRLARRSAFPV